MVMQGGVFVNNLGNKQTMAENILYYMDLHNKSRNDLCKDLGLKYTTLAGWLKAEKYPRIDKIEQMANYFGITKADLVENKNDTFLPSNAIPVGQLNPVPVVGVVRCGNGGVAFEEPLGFELADVKAPDEYFYLVTKGDSMEPDIREGEYALIHKQPTVESGEVAVVVVNGEEGTLKKVIKKDDAVILQALNPTYEPRFFVGEEAKALYICGKLVETKRKW